MHRETFYKITTLLALSLLGLQVLFQQRVDLGGFIKSAAAEQATVNCVQGKNGIKGKGCGGTVTLRLSAGGVINTAGGSGLQVNTTSTTGGTAALHGKQGAGSGLSNANVSAVLGDAEDGPGVVGLSANTVGVWGSSKTENGVLGLSDGNTAVSGISTGWHGVAGRTHSNTAAGVYASGATSSGIALKIMEGGITVEGAGENTNTPVFVHKVTLGSPSNTQCASRNYASVIDHPLTNGRSSAILLVTPNYGDISTGAAPAVGEYGVYYDSTDECGKGAGKWVIYNLNATPLVNGSRINVMVINP